VVVRENLPPRVWRRVSIQDAKRADAPHPQVRRQDTTSEWHRNAKSHPGMGPLQPIRWTADTEQDPLVALELRRRRHRRRDRGNPYVRRFLSLQPDQGREYLRLGCLSARERGSALRRSAHRCSANAVGREVDLQSRRLATGLGPEHLSAFSARAQPLLHSLSSRHQLDGWIIHHRSVSSLSPEVDPCRRHAPWRESARRSILRL